MEPNYEVEATPSPPPCKKAKVITFSEKRRTKLTTTEILHFYSFSEEKHTTPSPVIQKKKSKASTIEPMTEKDAVVLDHEGGDVTITKEV